MSREFKAIYDMLEHLHLLMHKLLALQEGVTAEQIAEMTEKLRVSQEKLKLTIEENV